jgi:hypothetical protein
MQCMAGTGAVAPIEASPGQADGEDENFSGVPVRTGVNFTSQLRP